MATYLLFGKYSPEAVKGISAKRTAESVAVIKQHGGELKAGYALLGGTDLLLIVDLPNTESAMKASVALSKLSGISFTASPAMSVEDFDKLLG